MKFSLTLALGLAALSCCFPASLRAEDWTTTDGKVYKNVTVIKTEPDAVTITDHDGGALVPLAKLSPDLQKRFNYDPVKAKAAANARTQDDAKNAVTLQAEINQGRNQKQAALIASDPRIPRSEIPMTHHTPTGTFDPMGQPDEAASSSSTEVISYPEDQTSNPPLSQSTAASTSKGTSSLGLSGDPLATDSSDLKHHSMDDLVDINSRLKDDHYSSNRHTAASLLLSSSYLMPDPLDPKHHSTDHLLQSASNLSKPRNP